MVAIDTTAFEHDRPEYGIESYKCILELLVQVVRANFKYFGMQTKVENIITNAQRDLFAKTLCVAFTSVDEWVDKSMADIRTLEAEVASKANKQLAGAVKDAAAIPDSATPAPDSDREQSASSTSKAAPAKFVGEHAAAT
jgi:hypothetical protein